MYGNGNQLVSPIFVNDLNGQPSLISRNSTFLVQNPCNLTGARKTILNPFPQFFFCFLLSF